jgi:3-mercaptopyruvate sulfurtransferase SseA
MRYKLSLLLISTLAFFVFTACQQSTATNNNTVANNTNANKNTGTSYPGRTDDTPRISLQQAKKDFDEGNVVFVDTREPMAFKQEHIQGALNIPIGDGEKRWKEIPTDKKIVAYCS